MTLPQGVRVRGVHSNGDAGLALRQHGAAVRPNRQRG
jgi:hypothetical protein